MRGGLTTTLENRGSPATERGANCIRHIIEPLTCEIMWHIVSKAWVNILSWAPLARRNASPRLLAGFRNCRRQSTWPIRPGRDPHSHGNRKECLL